MAHIRRPGVRARWPDNPDGRWVNKTDNKPPTTRRYPRSQCHQLFKWRKIQYGRRTSMCSSAERKVVRPSNKRGRLTKAGHGNYGGHILAPDGPRVTIFAEYFPTVADTGVSLSVDGNR